MPKDEDCIFCKIAAGEIPSYKLCENDTTLAFMDINPANPGHALIIPKGHWKDVIEIPDDMIGHTVATAKKVAQAITTILSPDGLNLVQANGKGAAQSVHHFHIHVLPRRLNDDLKLNWGLRPGNQDEIAALAERIAALLP